MNKNTSKTNKTSRRSFAKSAITALALTPIVSLTTRAEAQDDPSLRQSSPITVGGGGSVGIDFNQAKFAKRRNSTFFGDQDSLHKLWLIDKYGALEDITPASNDCEVTIECKNRRKVRNITITGKPLAITFDVVEFPKGPTGDGKKDIHHNKSYKIIKIDVKGKTPPVPPTTYDAPTQGKCTIVVVNSL